MSMPVFVSAFRSRRDLLLENLALRQQLTTLAPRRRPLIRTADPSGLQERNDIAHVVGTMAQ
jgi:hypothetical protein